MLTLLLAAGLNFGTVDAELAYDTAKELVEKHTPRDAGTIRGKLAANFLLDRASMAGANVRRDEFKADTPDGIKSFTNLYAPFVFNPEGEWVILLSHYDTKCGTSCPGANDGASTSALLVALAGAISRADTPFKHNLLMVWTDGEESRRAYGANDGLVGSRRALEMVKARGWDIRGVFCLDMLGDKNLDITIAKNSEAKLTKIAMAAAKRAGVPIKKSAAIIRDDHMPFLEAGYRSLDLIDFEYGSASGLNDYWHTSKDTIDNISVESLQKSGKLIVEILKILL